MPVLTLDATSTGLETLGQAITFQTGNIGSILTTVTAEPVLCLGLAMWCIGGAIGLFKRLV